jgi:hypothetical protein
VVLGIGVVVVFIDALVREERARALGELAFVALSTGQGVSCALIGEPWSSQLSVSPLSASPVSCGPAVWAVNSVLLSRTSRGRDGRCDVPYGA